MVSRAVSRKSLDSVHRGGAVRVVVEDDFQFGRRAIGGEQPLSGEERAS